MPCTWLMPRTSEGLLCAACSPWAHSVWILKEGQPLSHVISPWKQISRDSHIPSERTQIVLSMLETSCGIFSLSSYPFPLMETLARPWKEEGRRAQNNVSLLGGRKGVFVCNDVMVFHCSPRGPWAVNDQRCGMLQIRVGRGGAAGGSLEKAGWRCGLCELRSQRKRFCAVEFCLFLSPEWSNFLQPPADSVCGSEWLKFRIIKGNLQCLSACTFLFWAHQVCKFEKYLNEKLSGVVGASDAMASSGKQGIAVVFRCLCVWTAV